MALMQKAGQQMSAARCSSRGAAARLPAALPTRSSCSSRRGAAVVRAAAADDSAVPSSSAAPPVLAWPQDSETARDIFAFGGSLPERLNGRMAMLGFAGVALTELKDKVPAGEQFGNDVLGIALLSATFLMASLFPKFNTGYSLKELHAKATSANLAGEGISQALALFDTNTELWTGRIAMLGLTGLLIVEGVTGKMIF